MKTHFRFNGEAECGIDSKRLTNLANEVNCKKCMKKKAFKYAIAEYEAQHMRNFMAQPGRTIMEPWKHGEFMSCSSCGGNYFRTGDRTCYGHYDNFHCIKCGHVESRLTETGMSF